MSWLSRATLAEISKTKLPIVAMIFSRYLLDRAAQFLPDLSRAPIAVSHAKTAWISCSDSSKISVPTVAI
jgi:hypothetical protein